MISATIAANDWGNDSIMQSHCTNGLHRNSMRIQILRNNRLGVLQAGSVSSTVSERPRTTVVPVGLLRPGRKC